MKLNRRKCKNKKCRREFQKKRPLQSCCSVFCSIQHSRELKKQKEAKEWNERKKELKEKTKTYSQRVQEARRIFQKWIRLRDEDKPCISCGTMNSKLWDAGHYLKAEVYSGLIFEETNCHKQCRKCNRYLGGNETAYREGLVNRIDLDEVYALEAMKDAHRVRIFSNEQLEAIKAKYRKKIRDYETR